MNNVFDQIFTINPKISTSISFILGLILVSDLDTSEQNMLGNFIYLIGQTILTHAASQHLIEAKMHGNRANINSKEIKRAYNPVKYDLNTIKRIIKQYYPNNSEEIELLEKAIKELQMKINEIKKD